MAERVALVFGQQAIGHESPDSGAIIHDLTFVRNREAHAGVLRGQGFEARQQGAHDLRMGLQRLIPLIAVVAGFFLAFEGAELDLKQEPELAILACHEGDLVAHLRGELFEQAGGAIQQRQRLVGFVVAVDIAPAVGEVLADAPGAPLAVASGLADLDFRVQFVVDAFDAVGAGHVFDAGFDVFHAAGAQAEAGVLVVELSAFGVAAATAAAEGFDGLGRIGVGLGGVLVHGSLLCEKARSCFPCGRHEPRRGE